MDRKMEDKVVKKVVEFERGSEKETILSSLNVPLTNNIFIILPQFRTLQPL
jgi:hypothetical protein